MDNNTVLKLINMLNRKITKYSGKVNMILFIPSDDAEYELVQSPEEDSDYNSDYDSTNEDMDEIMVISLNIKKSNDISTKH